MPLDATQICNTQALLDFFDVPDTKMTIVVDMQGCQQSMVDRIQVNMAVVIAIICTFALLQVYIAFTSWIDQYSIQLSLKNK